MRTSGLTAVLTSAFIFATRHFDHFDTSTNAVACDHEEADSVSDAARAAKRGRLIGAGQAAGLSLPGAVHSAPFMKESFGVCARWLV